MFLFGKEQGDRRHNVVFHSPAVGHGFAIVQDLSCVGERKQGNSPVKRSLWHVMRALMECYWPEPGVSITVAFIRGRIDGPNMV